MNAIILIPYLLLSGEEIPANCMTCCQQVQKGWDFIHTTSIAAGAFILQGEMSKMLLIYVHTAAQRPRSANCLRVILNAWHFICALVLVFKAVYGGMVKGCLQY